MKNENFQQYKPAKTILEQLDYLNKNKRVQFNEMNRDFAGDKLLEYNYINVITPFKHKFAKLNEKKKLKKLKEVIYRECKINCVSQGRAT